MKDGIKISGNVINKYVWPTLVGINILIVGVVITWGKSSINSCIQAQDDINKNLNKRVTSLEKNELIFAERQKKYKELEKKVSKLAVLPEQIKYLIQRMDDFSKKQSLMFELMVEQKKTSSGGFIKTEPRKLAERYY